MQKHTHTHTHTESLAHFLYWNPIVLPRQARDKNAGKALKTEASLSGGCATAHVPSAGMGMGGDLGGGGGE